MAETLLGASGLRLFGQVVDDLTLKASVLGGGLGGLLARLQELEKAHAARLAPQGGSAPTNIGQFARIYGFSYEGQYFDLARPPIFLVFGGGNPVVREKVASTGAATSPPELASDLTVWEADQADLSVRLDVEVGPLERILLDAEIGPDQRVTMSGQNVRYAGQNVRYSGQNVRMSAAGQNVRLRYAGQNVRGGGD